MNWDQLEGKWDQIKGDLKTQWGKLTDDDLTVASSKKDKFIGRIQERYGILKEDAEKQVDEFIAKFGASNDAARKDVDNKRS